MQSQKVHDFLDSVLSEQDAGIIWETTLGFFGDCGFDGVFFADTGLGDASVLTNVADDWAVHYRERDYIHRDPFFSYCCTSSEISFTGPRFFDLYQSMTEEERAFILKAAETSFTGGVAVPLRSKRKDGLAGWHLFSHAPRPEMQDFVEHHAQIIKIAAQVAHRCLDDLTPKFGGVNRGVLSARERDCLALSASGLRSLKIADRLGIAVVTAEMHLRNARRKLKASTREHAVAIALAEGLIEL